MSHFTKIDRANIVNVDAFVSACQDLGFKEVRRNVEIKDYFGAKIMVDVAIRHGQYDIALKKNDTGTYDIVADWWGLRQVGFSDKLKNLSDEDIQNMLLKHTTKNTIVAKYKAQGWRATIREENDEFIVDLAKTKY